MVSFLELFYDLVYVVLIAQIAHTLAEHVGWAGVRDFAIVFVLIWLAWLNGTLYHVLNGREDGSSRSFIFAQMTVLVVMAAYIGHAADDVADGRGFAISYTVLLALLGMQWFGVRRYDTPQFAAIVSRYVTGIAAFAAVMMALAIAAAGAGMVTLVEQAADDRTPTSSAWLISGAVAIMAVALAALVSTMESHAGRRMVPASLVVGAVVALTLGALRPQPVVLALGLSAILVVVWVEAFVRHARNGLPLVEE